MVPNDSTNMLKNVLNSYQMCVTVERCRSYAHIGRDAKFPQSDAKTPLPQKQLQSLQLAAQGESGPLNQ